MSILKIKLNKDGVVKRKLEFVKLLKTSTNLGLKEAKDICDNLDSNRGTVTEITFPSNLKLKSFLKELPQVVEGYTSSRDFDTNRAIKILDLGIGDNNDYTSFITNYILSEPIENSGRKLNSILLKLDRDSLVDIFNEIKKDYLYE